MKLILFITFKKWNDRQWSKKKSRLLFLKISKTLPQQLPKALDKM